MIKRALLLALTLGAGACGVPTPEGFPLANADPAVTLALSALGITGDRRPLSIEGVDVQCQAGTGPGFINPDTGRCVGGLHVDGQIWIVVGEGQTYDCRLCHELIHWQWGDRDHDRAGLWSRERTCVAAFVAADPSIATIVPAPTDSR